jgi:hypothetical protein
MLKRNDFKQFRIRFSFCLSMIYPENRRLPFRIMLYAATDPLFVGAYARTVAVTDRDRMLRSDRDLVDDNSGRTGCRQSGHRGDEDAAFHDESPCLVPKKWLVLQTTAKGPPSFRRAAIERCGRASIQPARDPRKQVFVSKKQDRAGAELLPNPV